MWVGVRGGERLVGFSDWVADWPRVAVQGLALAAIAAILALVAGVARRAATARE